jgi:hypothetical protein
MAADNRPASTVCRRFEDTPWSARLLSVRTARARLCTETGMLAKSEGNARLRPASFRRRCALARQAGEALARSNGRPVYAPKPVSSADRG